MHYLDDLRAFRPVGEQEETDYPIMLEAAEKEPEFILTRESAIAHMTASSMIVSPDRTKVLMAYHNIYQSWAWTGGHADGDSDLFAVAMKEAREETGITRLKPLFTYPVSIETLNVQPHIKRGKYVSAHLHFNMTYAFEGDDTESIINKPDENAKVGWLPICELESYVSEAGMHPIYRKILGRLL